MFYLLSKIIPAIFYPLPLLFLFFLIWFIFAKKDKHPWVLFSVMALLYLFSTSFTVDLLAHFWEPEAPMDPFPSSEAIVVLGGSTSTLSAENPLGGDLNHRADRFLWGARLYQEGKAPLLLFSGGSGQLFVQDPVITEASIQGDWARALALPSEGIFLEEESRNTWENALFSQKILDEEGVQEILLVTSAFHMPRSRAIFEKLGYRVIPFSVDSLKKNLPFPFNFYPEPENLSNFGTLLKEWVGFITYGLMGFL